jgi:endonuclease/exonuclease/phosphatase family metal-dependent hydrolase
MLSLAIGCWLVILVLFVKCHARLFLRDRVRSPSSAQHLPSGRPLRCLTLNTFLRPRGYSDGDGDQKRERLHLMCATFHKYDVVLLQEVFSLGYARELQAAAEDLGFEFVLTPRGPSLCSWALVDNGLMILSRFPFLDSRRLVFVSSAGTDRVATKGASYVRLGHANSCIHIVNVHLQSQDGGIASPTVQAIQASQLDELSTWLETLIAPQTTDKLVVCGDFNLDMANTRDAALLQERLVTRASLVNVSLTNNAGPTCRFYRHRTTGKVQSCPLTESDTRGQFQQVDQTLDYVLARNCPDIGCRVTKLNDEVFVSDHEGVEFCFTA